MFNIHFLQMGYSIYKVMKQKCSSRKVYMNEIVWKTLFKQFQEMNKLLKIDKYEEIMYLKELKGTATAIDVALLTIVSWKNGV